MKEKLVRLNTAIKPPIQVLKKVIVLSQALGSQHEAEFILDGKNFYPHITVYSPLYPERNIDKIVAAVSELAGNYPAMEFKYIKVLSNQGFIGLEYEYTKGIKEFHEAVVRALNPLREGYHKPKYDTHDYRMKISEEKKQNIAEFGYPNVMSLYHSHLSIIRLKDEKVAEAAAGELAWDIPSYIGDTVALYKMGWHGTCIEPIKEFKLLNVE